ncbi:MAG: DUF92 domain-containing protein [Acidobacteriota bacterium]
MMNAKFSEDLRKIIHITMGGFALLLRWLEWYQAAFLALVALGFNLTILKKIGKDKIFRKEELKGIGGIIFYPLSVFILIILFRNHLHIAAAGWAMMALGDGMATLIGIHFGKKKIPWNKEKSYLGTIICFIFGFAGMSFFIWWVGARYEGVLNSYSLFIVPFLGAIFASFIESLPIRINDNLLIPISSGIFLYVLLLADPFIFSLKKDILISNFLTGIFINLIFAILGIAIRGVSISGFISGIFVGTGIYTFLGFSGFLILLLFFLIGTVSTKIGLKKKEKLHIAEERKGARSFKNVFGKGFAPLFFSYLAFSYSKDLFSIAFVSSLATGTFDTASSELGKVFGKETYSILSLKKVTAGEPGGFSLEGTLFGIFSALLISFVSFYIGLINSISILIVLISCLLANFFENIISSTIEVKGIISNEITNFINTLSGGLISIFIFSLVK